MADTKGSLSDFDRHSLYEACAREAQRIGGDERTAEYFFVRAQSSRVWLSSQGAVTVADMDIKDWCGAIAWSAPGIGRTPKRGKRKPQATANASSDTANRIKATTADNPATDAPAADAPSTNNSEAVISHSDQGLALATEASSEPEVRKQARSGARFRRAIRFAPQR